MQPKPDRSTKPSKQTTTTSILVPNNRNNNTNTIYIHTETTRKNKATSNNVPNIYVTNKRIMDIHIHNI